MTEEAAMPNDDRLIDAERTIAAVKKAASTAESFTNRLQFIYERCSCYERGEQWDETWKAQYGYTVHQRAILERDQLREQLTAAQAEARVVALEEASRVVHEQRCERGTQWDLAVMTCAKAIAALPRSAAEQSVIKDARRYRHMRASAASQNRNGPGLHWYLPRYNSDLPPGERLDAAIDAALASGAEGKGE